MKKVFPILALLPILLLGAGCSGIQSTHSISPMMFLLPGFGKTQPQEPAKAATTASIPQTDSGSAVNTL